MATCWLFNLFSIEVNLPASFECDSFMDMDYIFDSWPGKGLEKGVVTPCHNEKGRGMPRMLYLFSILWPKYVRDYFTIANTLLPSKYHNIYEFD